MRDELAAWLNACAGGLHPKVTTGADGGAAHGVGLPCIGSLAIVLCPLHSLFDYAPMRAGHLSEVIPRHVAPDVPTDLG